MKPIKILLATALTLAFCAPAFGQMHVRNDDRADPCLSSAVAKSSVAVNITTAATTQLVPLVAGQIIYVCGVNLTISQVVAPANTFRLVYGTGAACGTGTVNLTGDWGTGGVTAAPPVAINIHGGNTIVRTIASNALCATTTIGASASFAGAVTYIQQ